MAEKKVPLRRCAGCNEQKTKKEFVRVVRTPEGNVILDSTGKANGRGVYLCPKKSCLQKAKKARRLERNLDVSIPEEIWAQLEENLGE
jgi:predicted RNA-binding protein YlxR (DUF448 family)